MIKPEKRTCPAANGATTEHDNDSNEVETFDFPVKPGAEIAERYCWLQVDAAMEILRFDALPRFNFALPFAVYSGLVVLAAETEAEPGPGRDGKPFLTTVAALAQLTDQTIKSTASRLRDFARLGLIDPVTVPDDGVEPFSVRLRLLDDVKGGAR